MIMHLCSSGGCLDLAVDHDGATWVTVEGFSFAMSHSEAASVALWLCRTLPTPT